jgi:hypothetical protein
MVLIESERAVLRGEHRFFVGMAVAACATVFFGFAPSYYVKSVTHVTHYPTGVPVSPSLPLLVHVHAVAFSTWMLLFLAQSTLVAAGRTDIHRRLGVAAAALVPVMIVLGVMTAIRGAKDGWNPGGPYRDALAFMIVGLTDIVMFSLFVLAGLVYRRRPEVHKRLMLLGTVGGLMWPAITRTPYVAGRPIVMFSLLGALVLALAARDRMVRGRIHPVSLWGGLLILAAFPVRVAIGLTSGWHDAAAWLIR